MTNLDSSKPHPVIPPLPQGEGWGEGDMINTPNPLLVTEGEGTLRSDTAVVQTVEQFGTGL